MGGVTRDMEDTRKCEETVKDKFNSQYDAIQDRVSYEKGFRDYCFEELSFIAGVLDMLFLIETGDQWSNAGEEITFVIMDARNRANALTDVI